MYIQEDMVSGQKNAQVTEIGQKRDHRKSHIFTEMIAACNPSGHCETVHDVTDMLCLASYLYR